MLPTGRRPGLSPQSHHSSTPPLRLLLRYLRRPVLLVIAIGVSLFIAGLISDWLLSLVRWSSHESQEAHTPRVQNLILTVTKTHTAVVKTTTTKTVVLPEATGSADLHFDAFGFPIYGPEEEPPQQEDSASQHFYRADGLLEVNPDGPHPIFELIERAELAWKEKNDRASKTLKVACAEYERRYGRKPPKGFPRWWAYVQKHNVQLPDEYDQIHRDLQVFWAIDPLQLQQIQREWEHLPDSFTIGKKEPNAPISLLRYTETSDMRIRQEFLQGADLITGLMRDVETELPVFSAVFSPYDNPTLLSDWQLRKDAIETAERGEYLDLSHFREHKLHGWKSACSPLSPVWLDPLPTSGINGVTTPPTQRQLEGMKFITPHSNYSAKSGAPYPKTFIHDHAATLSPCDHPAHLMMHGQFLSYGNQGPVPQRRELSGTNGQKVYYGLIPFFSYSPTRIHDDITGALPLGWVEDVYPREDDPPFDEKPDYRLHWRGRNTGIWCGSDSDLENINRVLEKAVATGTLSENSQNKLSIGLDRAWWLSQRQRLIEWANRVWEGQYEIDSGSSSSNVLGVPHELWRRSDVIGDDDPASPGWHNDTILAISTRGVLRSPPSKQHSLSVSPGDRSSGIKHESRPLIKSDWAPAMCDISFAGSPINCEGRMCDKLGGMYEFRKLQGTKEQGRYKFVIDVDGNGWSSRFKRLITSNSLIFKSTIYAEWFTDRIQPWVHYVPIQVDFSDLLNTLYFFRGDLSHQNHHLDLASKIAHGGRDWSKKYWRRQDMIAYMYRLFLEYARVMGDEYGVRESYTYREEDEYQRD